MILNLIRAPSRQQTGMTQMCSSFLGTGDKTCVGSSHPLSLSLSQHDCCARVESSRKGHSGPSLKVIYKKFLLLVCFADKFLVLGRRGTKQLKIPYAGFTAGFGNYCYHVFASVDSIPPVQIYIKQRFSAMEG